MDMTQDQIECGLAADRVNNAYQRLCRSEPGSGVAMYAEQAGYATTIVRIVGHMLTDKPGWTDSMNRYLKANGVQNPDVVGWMHWATGILKKRREHYQQFRGGGSQG